MNRRRVEISPAKSPFFFKLTIDMIISEKLVIPESVTDLIEGRVPKKAGVRHYMRLLRRVLVSMSPDSLKTFAKSVLGKMVSYP